MLRFAPQLHRVRQNRRQSILSSSHSPLPVAIRGTGLPRMKSVKELKKKADSARYDIAMLRMFQNITMILKQNSDNDVFNNCSLKKKCNYFIKKN